MFSRKAAEGASDFFGFQARQLIEYKRKTLIGDGMFSTKTKVHIARALNRAIVSTRKALGYSSLTQIRRNGVMWHLDLDEGIDLAMYLGVYQKAPARVLNNWVHPGSIVLDIGANIGAFALPLARHVGAKGKVVAIEPTDFAFSKLSKNVSLNAELADRLILMQAALIESSSAIGATSFYSSWRLTGKSADEHVEHLGRREAALNAKYTILDQLISELHTSGRIADLPNFVKLDVDGHELDVLRGGERFFREVRPPILVEIAPHVQDEIPGRFESLVETFVDCGYRLEHPASGKLFPMTAEKLRSMIGRGASVDLLARPG